MRPLMPSGDPERASRMLVACEFDPPSRFNPEVPPTLDAIVMNCLVKDPERRTPTAQALTMQLREVLHELAPGYGRDQLARLLGWAFPEKGWVMDEPHETAAQPSFEERMSMPQIAAAEVMQRAAGVEVSQAAPQIGAPRHAGQVVAPRSATVPGPHPVPAAPDAAPAPSAPHPVAPVAHAAVAPHATAPTAPTPRRSVFPWLLALGLGAFFAFVLLVTLGAFAFFTFRGEAEPPDGPLPRPLPGVDAPLFEGAGKR